MPNFNTPQRAMADFPGLVSAACSFVFQHKNPATLKAALHYMLKEALSLESDKVLFSACSKLFPDLPVPASVSLRDAIVDGLARIIALDAVEFAGQSIDDVDPVQSQVESRYRQSVEKTETESDKPAVQGKTAEEMAALLANQSGDGCAGGGCII